MTVSDCVLFPDETPQDFPAKLGCRETMAHIDVVADDRAALKRVAARGTVGWNEGPGFVVSRRGAKLQRLVKDQLEETILLGAACSEVFSGPRLAKVLRPALEHQRKAIEAMEKDEPWEPLSIHTSAGLPAALEKFLNCLEKHLPQAPEAPEAPEAPGDANDWFVNLQLEGATAVWAGVEAVAHLRQALKPEEQKECLLGVAQASYHGAKTTALGQPALPRWPGAPRTTGQVAYPVPDSDDPKASEEYLEKFSTFLRDNPQVGIFLFEPQWGSSRLGRTWPPALLREVISRCHAASRFVLCDEVMCGLGRHGHGSLFLSAAWNLRPDAVTFGKSMASGTFPLSGVLVLHGGKTLLEDGAKILQSDTYAGSSALAYLTAIEILKEVPCWFSRAAALGCVVREILGPCQHDSFFQLHGQGLLWGGEFLDSKVVLKDFREACHEKKVWPYIVPSWRLGFMISPPMDIDEHEFREGLQRLAGVILQLHQTYGVAANQN